MSPFWQFLLCWLDTFADEWLGDSTGSFIVFQSWRSMNQGIVYAQLIITSTQRMLCKLTI